ncbi:MAG: 30S ribosomal protein S6 [Chloroflexota bacterium]
MPTKKLTKTAEKSARDYELTVVIRPELLDEALEASLENISRLITGKGGTVTEVERWGKRKLAYPIGHALEGIYVLIKFQGKPALCRDIEANLRISEEVLRHLLINLAS